jgi:hypothetical protein
MQSPPNYAVMINGKWGSGKTWFIKQFMTQYTDISALSNQSKNKVTDYFLYISLFGMTSVSDIDTEIFRNLHPLISSKTAAFAGKAVMTALKSFGLNLDANNDGKADSNISMSLPSIKLDEFFNDTNELILVLDDFERCRIPMEALLGYINYFIEYNDKKVILLANEEEVSDAKTDTANDPNTKPQKPSIYSQFREKVVGKAFDVKPNAHLAINAFVAEISNLKVRSVLQKHTHVLQSIHDQTNYHNLRHMRAGIVELGRLLNVLTNEQLKSDRIVYLIQLFLMLYIEARHSYSVNILKDFIFVPYGLLLEKNPHREIVGKYSFYDANKSILDKELWTKIIYDGFLDVAKIQSAIDYSFNPSSISRPAWIQLWYLYDRDEDEIEPLIKQLDEDVAANSFKTIQEVWHVFGVRSNLSKLNLYDKPVNDILNDAKQSIRHLSESGLLDKISPRDSFGFAYGLGYTNEDSSEFIELRTFTIGILESNEEKRNQALADKVEAFVKNNDDVAFVNMFTVDLPPTFNMSAIKQQSLIDAYISCNAKMKNAFNRIIRERLGTSRNDSELEWFKVFANLLKENSVKTTSFQTFHLIGLANYIQSKIEDQN